MSRHDIRTSLILWLIVKSTVECAHQTTKEPTAERSPYFWLVVASCLLNNGSRQLITVYTSYDP